MRFSPAAAGFRMPAEWEIHEATWLTFPHNIEQTWTFDLLPKIQKVYLEMIAALCQDETVHLCVKDETTLVQVAKMLALRNITENVRLHLRPTDSEWIRDYGGIFLKNDATGERHVLDWIFNNWGNKYEGVVLNNQIPQFMAETHQVTRIEMDFVLEGGSIEVNGNGIMLTTKACLLNKNRNPKYTQIEIEQILCDYFNVQKILWLDDGIIGDDTDGHIDDIARFVDENTILTVVEENKDDANYAILQENLETLKGFTNLEGKPFNIITLPMPNPIMQEDERLPATYANFLIGNSVVLLPIYNCPQDQIALDILQKCFPTRRIVGIDCTELIMGLGAFHCLSQQVPK